MKGCFQNVIVYFLLFQQPHQLLCHLALLHIRHCRFLLLWKSVFPRRHVKSSQFFTRTPALWKCPVLPSKFIDFINEPRCIDWVFYCLREDTEPLGVGKSLFELGLEHVAFGHNLEKHFVGNFLEPLSVLNSLGQWFLVPLFILFEPGDDCWKSFLFVMKVLPQIGNSILKLGNPLSEKGLIFNS